MLYSQLTDQVNKDIRVVDRDINKVVKDFNAGILTVAHKSIHRGAIQNYKPYWSEKLERLDEELSAARREAKTNPSQLPTTYQCQISPVQATRQEEKLEKQNSITQPGERWYQVVETD